MTFYPEESFQRILNRVSKKFSLLKPTRLPTNLLILTEYPVSPKAAAGFVSNAGHNTYSRQQK